MSRSDQSNGNVAPRETAKDVVVEFSRSPATFQWAESTPSHETETKSTDNVDDLKEIVLQRARECEEGTTLRF